MASLVALSILALLMLGALVEACAILRDAVPPRPASVRIGAPRDRAGTHIALPRVIWTYWDTPPPPALVENCLRLWKRCAPDHDVRLVDLVSARRWLGDEIDAAAFAALPAYRQADWLRLQMLIRHGGIWMDGSTLLTRDLEWVHGCHEDLGAGTVAFYIDRYTTNPSRPIVENWFLAAPPGDPFLIAWAAELERALALGESSYLEALRREGRLDAAAQAIPAGMRSYLVMHLAASCVLLREAEGHRLLLLRAEDIAFAFHAALRWRKRHLYARLALTPMPRRVPALIKLRSVDRRTLEQGLARGWLWRRSLLARLLGAPA
jgi:hypothetical protein